MIRITQLIILYGTVQISRSLDGLQLPLLSSKVVSAQLAALLNLTRKQLSVPLLPGKLATLPEQQLPALSNPIIGSAEILQAVSTPSLRRQNVLLSPLSNNNMLVNVDVNRAVLNPVLRPLTANLLNRRLLLNTGINNQILLNRRLNLGPVTNIQSSGIVLDSGINSGTLLNPILNTGSLLNTGLNRVLVNSGVNLRPVSNIGSRGLLLDTGLVSGALVNPFLSTRTLLNTGRLSTGTLLNTGLNTLSLRRGALLPDTGVSVGLGETLLDPIDDIGTRILNGI